MAGRIEHLHEMVKLVGRLYAGFIEDEIREMVVASVVQVGGVGAVALRPRDLCT